MRRIRVEQIESRMTKRRTRRDTNIHFRFLTGDAKNRKVPRHIRFVLPFVVQVAILNLTFHNQTVTYNISKYWIFSFFSLQVHIWNNFLRRGVWKERQIWHLRKSFELPPLDTVCCRKSRLLNCTLDVRVVK